MMTRLTARTVGVVGLMLSSAWPAAALPQSAEPNAAKAVLSADDRLSASEVREDLGIFRRAYSLLHPGLLRYNTPETLAASFDALEKDLAGGATLERMYLRISEFLATIRCGHSYPNFYNQPKAIVAALFTGRNRVPFAFRWFDGEMVVTRNFSGDAGLAPGTRIVSINGTPTREVLARLMAIARADGGNDSKRLRILEVSCIDDWEAFDIYFPMYFPLREPLFELAVLDDRGAERVVRVPAIDSDQRLEQVRLYREESKSSATSAIGADVFPDGGWVFRAAPGATASLKMASWGIYNSKEDWQSFLHSCMDKAIALRCPDLIIDLRGNEGGMDCGDLLIERLIDQPLAKPRVERRVMYRKTPEDLNPFLDTWDDSFRDWGNAAQERAEGGFVLNRGDGSGDDNIIRPSRERYTGRVWLLIDGVNSSATFQFAWIMNGSKLATLVGEPTGGNQRGINGGSFFFLRLPRSGIEIDLPLIAFHPVVAAGEPQPADSGITPDIVVLQTPADIAAGRDPVMAKALEMIGAGK
jgi:hypothetical protein